MHILVVNPISSLLSGQCVALCTALETKFVAFQELPIHSMKIYSSQGCLVVEDGFLIIILFGIFLGGRIVFFDRKMLRNFRKDGHNWKKKNDGKTVKEAHEHLKVSFRIGKMFSWHDKLYLVINGSKSSRCAPLGHILSVNKLHGLGLIKFCSFLIFTQIDALWLVSP